MLCLLLATFGSAQTITNVRQTIENGRIVIKYDLNGIGKFDIKITATDKTNMSIIPSVVAGEIQSVSAGRDHFIWWEPQLEGRALPGWTVELKVKAQLPLLTVKQSELWNRTKTVVTFIVRVFLLGVILEFIMAMTDGSL